MVSLQGIVRESACAAPQEQAKNPAGLPAPACHDVVLGLVEVFRPLQHGQLVVAGLVDDIQNLEAVIQQLADYILNSHEGMRTAPYVVSAERADGILLHARRSVKVESPVGLQETPQRACEAAIVGNVFDDAIHYRVVIRFVGFVIEILQEDLTRTIVILNDALDEASRIGGNGQRCDVNASRATVLRNTAPSTSNVEAPHARLLVKTGEHWL